MIANVSKNNKQKQELKAIHEKNQELAMEMSENVFKPHINQVSRELGKKFQPLMERIPGLLERKLATLESANANKQEEELKECTFSPQMMGAKVSEEILSRRVNSLSFHPQK